MTLILHPDSAKPRRRGRPALNTVSAVDEDVLLARVFDAFAERGFEGTMLRDLAKQLGVSHNLFNVRFGTKDELWRRAVDWRFARAAAPVLAAFDTTGEASGLDDEARLRQVVTQLCAWTAANPDIIGLTFAEGRRDSWRLDHIVAYFLAPFQAQLEALLQAVARHRHVYPISTAAFMAVLVQGAGFYFASGPLRARIGDGTPSDPTRLADFLLTALLAPGLSPAIR